MFNLGSGRRAGVGAAVATSGTAILACGACCILPLALPAVIVAGLGGSLSWFAKALPWLTLISLIAVAVAWVMVWRESRATGKRASKLTLLLMLVATVMLAISLAWPFIEERVLAVVIPLLKH